MRTTCLQRHVEVRIQLLAGAEENRGHAIECNLDIEPDSRPEAVISRAITRAANDFALILEAAKLAPVEDGDSPMIQFMVTYFELPDGANMESISLEIIETESVEEGDAGYRKALNDAASKGFKAMLRLMAKLLQEETV
jgi:hypothetical protein